MESLDGAGRTQLPLGRLRDAEGVATALIGYLPFIVAVFTPLMAFFPILIVVGWVVMLATRGKPDGAIVSVLATLLTLLAIFTRVALFGMS